MSSKDEVIEIRTEGYWNVFTLNNFFSLEVTSKPAAQYEIDFLYVYGSEIVPIKINHKFTIDEVEAIVKSIIDTKNPRPIKKRGFFEWLLG